VVSTADVRSLQANDTLNFTIPGFTGNITAVATRVTQDSIEGYSWSGKLLSHLGYISLRYAFGQTFGSILIEDEFYEILPLDNTYQFLVNRKTEHGKNCGNEEVESGFSGGPGECDLPAGYNPYNTCESVVTVLLVITKEAEIWILNNYGSLAAFALQGQDLTNLAFLNSDIPNKEIRVRWITRDYSSSLSTSGSIAPDLLGLDMILESDRDTEHADMAFLITNQGYTNAYGGVRSLDLVAELAYGIIEAPFFTSNLTFQHEVAHILGCHHNWPSNLGDDDTNTNAHARRIIIIPENINYENVNDVHSQVTIVGIEVFNSTAYLLDDGNGSDFIGLFVSNTQILHYSNPEVNYGIHPTGTSCANNAGQIRNSACIVAEFMESQELEVFIENVNGICGSLEYEASIIVPTGGSQGGAPYDIKWYWSPNGNFSPNDEVFLDDELNLILTNHPSCPVYWLKCVVTSSDGITVTAIKKITLSWECCPYIDPGGFGKKISLPVKYAVEISPNPTRWDGFQLETTYTEPENVHFEISTPAGQLMQSGTFQFEDGVFWLETPQLESGMYFLSLHFPDNSNQSSKLVVIK
jgi:hypothetical protein